jgi:hypothetical protein
MTTQLSDYERGREDMAREIADDEAAVERFADWFRRNYPGPDTIIGKPDWHAPKIFRAAIAALRRPA